MDLLTPRETARRFAVTTATVRRWALDGRLTVHRTLGGHRRYDRTQVDALLRIARR